jgi:hypothetical protein
VTALVLARWLFLLALLAVAGLYAALAARDRL